MSHQNNQYFNQQPFSRGGPQQSHPNQGQYMRPQQMGGNFGGQSPSYQQNPGHGMQQSHQGGQTGQYGNMQGQGYRKPSTGDVNRGGRYPPRGNPSGFGNAPSKSSNALVARGPINLITNNFKIKSSSNGIIYTYAVEFIDGE
jgi:hypothetical protein